MDEMHWIESVWQRLCAKMEKAAVRSRNKLPYSSIDGRHTDMKEQKITWWTNGFWGGLMWLLYADTSNPEFRKTAERSEELLDEAFLNFDGLHHDVGFMWHITSGVSYRLNQNANSRLRALYAANLLAGRYNVKGGYIQAWNMDKEGYSIIDSMMNLCLLYWASAETGQNRYKNIAISHADMAARDHVRPDGSVYHIVDHNPETGEIKGFPVGQGMTAESSWSRGQAWALYGFILSYIHTGKQNYLDTAKRVAHYFIAAVCGDYLPRCDFRSPEEPVYYDSTAGAIAACGLLELAGQVSEYERAMYYDAALRLLRTMEERFCCWDEDEDAVLFMGTEAYGAENKGKNIPIIYGDYFFAEALYKLRGNQLLFW